MMPLLTLKDQEQETYIERHSKSHSQFAVFGTPKEQSLVFIMGLPETVAFARNFAVMVRVRGPDPKGMKMRRHAFHQYRSGETTLSASGFLIPDTLYDEEVARHLYGDLCEGMGLVVTVASVVEPFLSLHQRENVPLGRPELISGVQMHIMTEKENTNEKSEKGTPFWVAAQLLSLVDIPVSAHSLQSLVEASLASPELGWEVGWSLASCSNDSQPHKDFLQTQGSLAVGQSGSVSLMCKSLARVAILGVSVSLKDLLDGAVSFMNKRGDFLLAIGSPFGVLSPTHFFNSISVGCIANCYPPNSSDKSLLMADMRCLPGMEGAPVFSEYASLTGILIRPLRQKTSGVEIQLVIPWEAIVTASSGLLRKWPQNSRRELYHQEVKPDGGGKAPFTDTDNLDETSGYKHEHSNFGSPTPLLVKKAMASICLITVDDRVWASGVLLNSQGLVLTNAHLLEPWRFAKTHVSGRGYGDNPKNLPFLMEGATYEGSQKRQTLLSKMSILNPFATPEQGGYLLNPTYKSHQIIRVRLDHVKPCVWCEAKVVYVSKGPWDVALLQIESVPDQLSSIVMNFAWPTMGSKAYVIGHGLFGPRCGFFPSVGSGVVTKVVEAMTHQCYLSIQQGHIHGRIPAMLETTAAVHPGASGGAVINLDGHMIGLVTSNARHSGGTVIPHLNFSIPCAALAPIYEFSKDMQDLSLLRILDEPNEYISSVWALMRPSSPTLPPVPDLPQSLLDDNGKERKGSQFAKFVAERKEIFNQPSRQGKSGVLSNKVTPSKL